MKKHDQAGFAHLLIPIIIILVVAVAGTFVLVASKAASCSTASKAKKCQIVSGPVSAPVSEPVITTAP